MSRNYGSTSSPEGITSRVSLPPGQRRTPEQAPRDPLLADDEEDENIRIYSNFTIVDAYKALDFKSIAIENKGSVARDHMANERTFLAWLRTSLSFITIGIGITQLARLESKSESNTGSSVSIQGSAVHLMARHSAITTFGKPLGIVFLLLGIVTLIFGFLRFFKVQAMLTRNYYPASRLSIMVLIASVFIVIVVTFGVIVTAT